MLKEIFTQKAVGNKIKKYLHLILFFCALTGHAEIRTAPSLDPILQELSDVAPGTLLLLDVNGTLLGHPDAIMHEAHRGWLFAWLNCKYPSRSYLDTIELFRIIEGKGGNLRLLDARWPALIGKGTHVLAFTRTDTMTREELHDALLNLGLSFEDHFGFSIHESSFSYAKGLIMTSEKFKGPVLREFIERLPEKPAKIILIDDREEQVRSVDQICQEMGIPCLAYHLTAYKDPPLLNEEIVEYQLRILFEEKRWILEDDIK